MRPAGNQAALLALPLAAFVVCTTTAMHFETADLSGEQLNSRWSWPSIKQSNFNTRQLDWISFADMGLRRNTSDMWGITVNGKHVAAMAVTCEIVFVDVTDPSHMHYLGKYTTPCTDTHDVKGYGDKIYLSSDNRPHRDGYEQFGNQSEKHGLVQRFLIDPSNITNITELSPLRIAGRNSTGTVPNACHNIAVNQDNGLLYIATMRPYEYDGTEVFDLNTEPPRYIGRLQTENRYRVFHDLQALIPSTGQFAGKEIVIGAATSGMHYWGGSPLPGQPYLYDPKHNESAHEEDGIAVWDVTDKSNVVEIGFFKYNNRTRFPHQVWCDDTVSFCYVNDEGYNGFWMPPDRADADGNRLYDTEGYVVDLRNTSDPKFTSFSSGVKSHAHNMYIWHDGYLYYSQYEAGVTVYDLADPFHPKRVARFDSDPTGDAGWGGSWSNFGFPGFVLSADRYYGLFSFELDLCGHTKDRFKKRQCCSAAFGGDEPALDEANGAL